VSLSDEDVRRLPDPVLARRCDDVDPLDGDVVALADAMVALMRVSPHCVGIAAPQVGRPWRLFVLDTTGHKKARSAHGLVVMTNPLIVERSGEETAREGCLSVPDLTGDVPRSASVVVSGVEPRTGRTRVVEADAFEARAFQHEIDHLSGRLYTDLVEPDEVVDTREHPGVPSG